MGNTPDPDRVDQLLESVRPRWTRERHERVFAEIVERIRREEGRGGRRAARLQLSHATR
jgi:hypothetical protein